MICHTNDMKKICTLLLTTCIAISGLAFSGFSKNVAQDLSLTIGCKSAYLMDSQSGECVYSLNETKRLPIASVCKVMTLTLVFDAIAEGRITYADQITVSENASGMGGSQVFLDGGCQYPVDQLIKSIVVCSANDSCVALAETIAGGEDAFVSAMNKKAAELGCVDTLFANCTGLPKETQYSCARDVAVMFTNLIRHEDYYKYSKIWLEDFIHPDNRVTSMTNTNKLIRKYSFCDGGKTGFTNEAGFCLTATAIKNNLRLVSVVLGADSSDNRFSSTIKMFDYGFANYKNMIVLDKDVTLNDEFAVCGGKKESCAVRPERDCYIFTNINNSPEITHKIVVFGIKAPVSVEQKVGEIEVYRDGILADTVSVVAAESVAKANFGDYFRKNASEWAF